MLGADIDASIAQDAFRAVVSDGYGSRGIARPAARVVGSEGGLEFVIPVRRERAPCMSRCFCSLSTIYRCRWESSIVTCIRAAKGLPRKYASIRRRRPCHAARKNQQRRRKRRVATREHAANHLERDRDDLDVPAGVTVDSIFGVTEREDFPCPTRKGYESASTTRLLLCRTAGGATGVVENLDALHQLGFHCVAVADDDSASGPSGRKVKLRRRAMIEFLGPCADYHRRHLGAGSRLATVTSSATAPRRFARRIGATRIDRPRRSSLSLRT